ncbi:MAG: metallophosphoesterase [Spirochaetes bacterium]|nr:metallophosphoesterase [Spirochaetota bacterium]
MIKIKLYSLVFFLALMALSCSYEKATLKSSDNRHDVLIIWALSDIQPRNDGEREAFETSVSDVKNNIPKPDMAIVAGDIFHSEALAETTLNWFIKSREGADIEYWFEIAGNHDMKNFEAYKKYIKKPLYYSVEVGNLLILFMSDEDRFPPTFISDDTFNWWKKKVIENQDKIIITVTHAYLKNSGLFLANKVESRAILNSERFEEVLKTYRVDLWLAAHTHVPSFLGFNENVVKEFNNTAFINISRIRRDMYCNPESRVIILKNNSPEMIIKTRDHNNEEYIKRREVIINLKKDFIFKNNKPVLLLELSK